MVAEKKLTNLEMAVKTFHKELPKYEGDWKEYNIKTLGNEHDIKVTYNTLESLNKAYKEITKIGVNIYEEKGDIAYQIKEFTFDMLSEEINKIERNCKSKALPSIDNFAKYNRGKINQYLKRLDHSIVEMRSAEMSKYHEKIEDKIELHYELSDINKVDK